MTRQRVPYEVLPFGPSWAIVYCPKKDIDEWEVISVHARPGEAPALAAKYNAHEMYDMKHLDKLKHRLELVEQSETPDEWANVLAALRVAIAEREDAE